MRKHIFLKKELPPGADFVLESCHCGARRRRYASTRVLYEQSNGTFSIHKTECLGAYAQPVETHERTPAVKNLGAPPLLEAVVIIRLLLEDRRRGELCAKNFFQSYAI